MKKNGFNYYNLVDGIPYDENGNVMDDGYYIPDEGWHPNDSIYEEEEEESINEDVPSTKSTNKEN